MKQTVGVVALALTATLLLLAACSESGPTSVSGSVTLAVTEGMEGNDVRIEVQATVRDASGAPIAGQPIVLESTAGTFDGAPAANPRAVQGATDENGSFQRNLRAKQDERVMQILARAGNLASSIQIGLSITMYRWTILSSDPDEGQPEEEIVEAPDATTLERTYETPQELTVTLEVSDDPDAEDLLAAGEEVPYASSQTIEYSIVPANEPPVADAGPDQQAECVSYEDFGMSTEVFLGEGATLEVILPVGPHEITLKVTDQAGETATDTVVVEIVDTTPPSGSITFPADGACFGPADLPVTITDDFTDICADDLPRPPPSTTE